MTYTFADLMVEAKRRGKTEAQLQQSIERMLSLKWIERIGNSYEMTAAGREALNNSRKK